MSRVIRKPEVKSPAGHWPQLHAAIEAGADGVYFGLRLFTARAKTGFLIDELPEAMRTLRGRGVRGYVTFNTLIFEHELSAAARAIASIAEAGVDGIIVQDYAAVKLAREIAPHLELHGSTQMTVTDARGVNLAHRMGVARVTLARELSLDELRRIAAETECDLEIFVHGALCVAYSGQCLSSEAWGGRSANRGQCAQACRLPYEMMVDGKMQPLGDARYLLSPGDLYALHQIPEIVAMGITALKIEGRYKDAEYVALTTKAYREAVDAAWSAQILKSEGAVDPYKIEAETELQLEQVYSRGLGPYFLSGTNHQAVVTGRAPRHRGVRIGAVLRAEGDRVVIKTDVAHRVAPLKAGDGLVFDAADWRSPEEPEEGGRVFDVAARPDGTVELGFGRGSIQTWRIRPGDAVWRTHDPDVDRAARKFTQAAAPVARQRVDLCVRAHASEPLSVEWSLPAYPEIRVHTNTTAPLDAARDRGMTLELLRDQLGRLGGTPYELGEITLDLQGAPFAPVSVLNQLRREAVEKLQAEQLRDRHAEVHDAAASLSQLIMAPAPKVADSSDAQLHLLVRTPEQLEAALDLTPSSITLDYLDFYGLRPSVERVKALGIAARVASPRVMKPGESRILNFLLSLDCAILVRPAGLLDALQAAEHPPLIGDFSLNATNSVAADLFFTMGIDRITPAHDLNAAQVAELARHTGGDRVEVVAYQHLPVFHTEHCVFCRFLSAGTSYRDCGRPCETHRVELKDPSGRSHPVIADVGCRNTVFGAEAQEASAHLDAWRRAGVRHWRLEFVHESGDQVRRLFRAFQKTLLAGGPVRELANELKSIAPEGTTQGSLYVAPDYRLLPILP